MTKHSITLEGQKIAYTATAGNYLMKAEDGTPKASIFYVAYTRDGMKEPGERPVTFSFNGGPGAAAVWVQMGAFGPKIVERTEEGVGFPPPGKLIDSPFSILDVTTWCSSIRFQPATAGRCRGRRQAAPRHPAGHRVGGRAHPPLDHPQRALGLAQVPWPARATARPAPPLAEVKCLDSPPRAQERRACTPMFWLVLSLPFGIVFVYRLTSAALSSMLAKLRRKVDQRR